MCDGPVLSCPGTWLPWECSSGESSQETSRDQKVRANEDTEMRVQLLPWSFSPKRSQVSVPGVGLLCPSQSYTSLFHQNLGIRGFVFLFPAG